MDSIIKKLFSGLRSQKNISVPEEFSWDNMKEGIFEKMADDGNPPVIVANNSRRNKWFRRSFLLLLLLVCTFLLKDNLFKLNSKYPATKAKTDTTQYNQAQANLIENSNEKVSAVKENDDQLNNSKTIKPDIHIEDVSNSSKNYSVNTGTELKSKTIKQVKLSQLNDQVNPVNVSNKSNASLINSNNKTNSGSVNTESISEKNTSINTESGLISNQNKEVNNINISNQRKDSKISESGNVEAEKGKITRRYIQNNLSLLPSGSISGIQLNDLSFNETLFTANKPPVLSSWSLGLVAGAGLLGSPIPVKYLSATSPYSVKETALVSPYVKLYVKKDLKNNFFLTSGLEFQNNRSYLEFRRESMMKINLKDTILTVIENLITGETSYERGDTVVDALFSHSVKHLNVTNVLQIPVLLGYNFNADCLKVGISAGANFNIFTQHSGRTYSLNAEIIDINDNDKYLVKNVGISLLANLNLGYRLSPHYNLVLEAGYQKYLKNWRKESIAEAWRPAQMRVGVGVEYRF